MCVFFVKYSSSQEFVGPCLINTDYQVLIDYDDELM